MTTPPKPAGAEYVLQPCPFCGNDKIRVESNGIGDFFAVCDADDDAIYSCGASTSAQRCESTEQAVRRWNVRPASPRPAPSIEARRENKLDAEERILRGTAPDAGVIERVAKEILAEIVDGNDMHGNVFNAACRLAREGFIVAPSGRGSTCEGERAINKEFFDSIQDFPESLRKAFLDLESYIGDFDGKTLSIVSHGDNDEMLFSDEGTVVVDDAVGYFNTIVREVRALLAPPTPAGSGGDEREAVARIIDCAAIEYGPYQSDGIDQRRKSAFTKADEILGLLKGAETERPELSKGAFYDMKGAEGSGGTENDGKVRP